jgi:hypothetical protein
MTEQWRRWSAQFVALVLSQLVKLEARYQLELRKQACFDTRANREAMWIAWTQEVKETKRERVRLK